MVICVLQSYSEIQIYLKHQIYTATSIEQFDEAKVNLVFCDTQPYTNISASVEDLKNHIIRPMSGSNMTATKLLTMYHGVCLQFEMDLLEVLGGKYLYLDYGKRFCLTGWKSILMYAHFPGYAVQMTTLDPGLLIKETKIGGSTAWYEAKLMMTLDEKLPKKSMECEVSEHDNDIKKLEDIHTKHEACILNAFMVNWSQRNKTCSPFIMKNFVNSTDSINYCPIGGEEHMINDDIYPAMTDSCLRPCTQVTIQ